MPSILLLASLTFQWNRTSTIDIEVISDATEQKTRRLLDRLQEARLVMPDVSPLPVRVYWLTTGDWFRRLRPEGSASAYASTDRSGSNVIVLSANVTDRTIRHEYAHLVLEQTSVLPSWLDEGLADFYSATSIRDKRLVIGESIREHRETADALGLRDALAAPSLPGRLYPVAWAFVHMLRLAPGYKDRFGVFWKAIRQKGDSIRVLEESFGRPLGQMEVDLDRYLRQPVWPTESLPLPDAPPAFPRVEIRPVSPMEFEDEYVDLLRNAGQAGEATRFLAGLSEAKSKNQALRRAQAALADGRLEAARGLYEKALELPGAQGDAWYEYGALLRDLRAEPSVVRPALEKAVALSPRLRPARLMLAAMASQAGEHEAAARHLEAALEFAPRQFDVLYDLAFAYRSAGQTEQSRRAAERALLVARTAQQKERAEALAQPPVSEPVAKPGTKKGKAWTMPEGDAQAQGRFIELVCDAPAKARFQLTEGSVIELTIADPSKVALRNAGEVSTEWRCGPQDPRRAVKLGYESRTKELRWLDFKPR